jgi:hypothetical protein
MRRPHTSARAITAAALAVAGGLLAAAPADAAPPTRIRDVVTSIACKAVDGSTIVRFAVATSDLEGSEAVAQVADAGTVLSEGYGTSDWTASTFRAAVTLKARDGGGGHLGPVGDAYLSGSYAVTGTPEREVNRFKDGNIRVTEDHTTTALTVSDVTLTIDGGAVGDVECAGDRITGSLFFTNPSSYVLRGGFLVTDDCHFTNMRDFSLFGTADAAYASFWYDDTVDSSAATPELDLTAGPWTGELLYNDGTGPAGTVTGSVSAVRNGKPFSRVMESTEVVRERWKLTPYLFRISAEGRTGADASATCQVYDVSLTMHVKTGKLGG